MTTPLSNALKSVKKPSDAADEKTAKACPNCGSVEPWGTSSWCPDCGYYPALGGTSLKTADEVNAEDNSRPNWERESGPANLMEAVPPWAWVALGGALLVFAGNVAFRVLIPLKGSHRALLTISEFMVGLFIAGIAHFSAYLFAVYKSDKIGPFDFFMKPVEIWKATVVKLPQTSRRVCFMVWGLAATFSALFILGGIHYDSLFDDWGIEKREKPNLAQDAVQHARRKRAEPENLEDAVKKITGEILPEDLKPPLLETDCVIFGYTKSELGELQSLLLASAPQGRLSYVGLLSPEDVPEDQRAAILKELQAIPERKSSYVKQAPLDEAIWVEPKLLCRITHEAWTSQYRLQQPAFKDLILEQEKKEEKKKEEK